MKPTWHSSPLGTHWADIAGHRLNVTEHGPSGNPTEFCRWGVMWRNRFIAFGFCVPTVDEGKAKSEAAAREHIEALVLKRRSPSPPSPLV